MTLNDVNAERIAEHLDAVDDDADGPTYGGWGATVADDDPEPDAFHVEYPEWKRWREAHGLPAFEWMHTRRWMARYEELYGDKLPF